MNLFNKRPGFVRSAPGSAHRNWLRLPAILLWGTLSPRRLAGANHALAPAAAPHVSSGGSLLMRHYVMHGLVALNWMVVLTLVLGCFIVRLKKGPAYVADADPLPQPAHAVSAG